MGIFTTVFKNRFIAFANQFLTSESSLDCVWYNVVFFICEHFFYQFFGKDQDFAVDLNFSIFCLGIDGGGGVGRQVQGVVVQASSEASLSVSLNLT